MAPPALQVTQPAEANVPVPPLIVSTDEERRLFEAGESRYTTCRIDDETRTLCALD